MMIFEVQTQRGAQNWITQSNWDNSADALREANHLVGSRRFRGVKVIKSRLDPDNMFRETTIFRHQMGERRKSRVRPPIARIQPPDAIPEHADQPFRIERRTGTLAWIICLGIASHAALGIALYTRSDRILAPTGPSPGKAVVYELPAVMTDTRGASGGDRVRATLRLEADDPAIIDRTLPSIVDNLSKQLKSQGAAALRRR